MNMVSGIIIDTFAELRVETQERHEDFTKVCYVCGISEINFEKKGIDFNQHISLPHNKFHYLFYLISLEQKNPLDYDAIDIMISGKQ